MKNSSLRKLYELTHISMYIYNCVSREVVYKIPEKSIFEVDNALVQELIRISETSLSPMIWFEDEVVYYGYFVIDENIWMFGPFSRNMLTEDRTNDFRRKHHYKEGCIVMNEMDVATFLSMMYSESGGKEIEAKDILDALDTLELVNTEKELEEYELERSEYGQSHQDMEYEKRLLRIVETGDVAQLKKYAHETSMVPQIGIVAKNSKKRLEYLTVSLITLMSRTVVSAGVGPQIAFNLSDIFLQKLESCNSADEVGKIGSQATFEFTELVNEYQNSKNYYIEACKDIINKKLRMPIQISKIADDIGISRVYLSRRFKEIEGITIQQYIMKIRCKHVANMLKYSDYSIATIAEYFCFASQSHLSMHFKKYYGMTPHQYKIKNHYSSKK